MKLVCDKSPFILFCIRLALINIENRFEITDCLSDLSILHCWFGIPISTINSPQNEKEHGKCGQNHPYPDCRNSSLSILFRYSSRYFGNCIGRGSSSISADLAGKLLPLIYPCWLKHLSG